jgi:hypothetical protein
MLLLDFDELTDNPENVLQKVYTFLDLPFCFPEKYEVKNESLPVSRDFRKIIYSLNRFSPKPLRNILKKIIIGTMPKQQKRVLTDKEKEYTHRELRDEMKALHDVYGINVQKWGFTV